MLFNSGLFAVFFPVVVLLYFACQPRWRWALLLVASCLFYMAAIPGYLLILAFTIGTDYVAARAIARSQGLSRRAWLGASIAANIGVLFFFKYYDFFFEACRPLMHVIGFSPPGPFNLLLPIGLSFHTFQALSYTIEVYRGRVPAERHLGIFALYVMFFPQLVAGPIERPAHLLPQFREVHSFDAREATHGVRLIAWGLFKKVVIADRLAIIVTAIFNTPTKFTGPVFVLVVFAFSYQIYCDFSGYTDVARGAARVLGFRLVQNFDRPYSSSSVLEFWHRWHMSLSTWFRDYVYIPLGGSRHGAMRRDVSLMVTFLASGLWHGANWTFLAWGALHGSLAIASIRTRTLRARVVQWTGLNRAPRIHMAVQVAVTLALVSYGWIWFRAPSVADALYITTHLTVGWDHAVTAWKQLAPALGSTWRTFALLAMSIAGLELVQYWQQRRSVNVTIDLLPAWGRWTLYYAAAASIAFLGMFNDAPFIYFQF